MSGAPSRRAVLRAGIAASAAAGAAGPLAGCAAPAEAGSRQTGALIRSALPLPPAFSQALRVPPTSVPVPDDGGDVVRHRIVARAAELEILPGRHTPALTYGGTFPGPTIVAARGTAVQLDFVNQLDVPAVVHLHGGVTPAASDGFPTDLVLPGGTAAATRTSTHDAAHGHGAGMADPRAVVTTGNRRYTFPMDQPAATLWYHDHRMDFTGPMVYRGLAGFWLVRDEVEQALPLPTGERDLPLMIADRSFAADGSFAYPALDPTMRTRPGVTDEAMPGVLGDVVLVNGVPWPLAEVDAARYRLRLLNASNARRYRLRLDPGPPDGGGLVQIGSDVALLPRPIVHDRLTMAPGERYDVVVDFGAYPVGTRVTLGNDLGGGRTADVMQFVVARRPATPDAARVPDRLAPDDEPVTAGAVRRTFHFRRRRVDGKEWWTVNDLPFDPTRMLASVPAGTTEVWRFGTDLHHPVHVHLGHFRVLSRGGRSPSETDAGWKDTVDVRAADFVDVAVRFPRMPGRYLVHCHNLEHEDMAMMAAFEVV